MSSARQVAALVGLGLAGLPACSAEVDGQLILAIQTDMAMPKDIDRIRIEVTYVKTGAAAYQMDFTKLGESDSIQLPATLGFIAPADPSEAIRVRALAGRGPEESTRLLREIVTTVPTSRVATLRVPIEFLCDGAAAAERDPMGQVKRDGAGRVVIKDNCPEGLTCAAGTCVPEEIPSEALPDYDVRDIFGGGSGIGDGSCFDTAQCLEEATLAELDMATFAADPLTCRAAGGGDINVALSTQGPGMCGKSGCFVALDAESDSGWKVGDPGFITLPPAVCAQVAIGKLVGVVTAPVGACPQKRVSLPTCGPWSSSGDGQFTMPKPDDPMLLAPGQISPVSLAVAPGTLFWTNSGTFDESGESRGDGTVKRVALTGGQPGLVATDQAAPHDITYDEPRQFVLWTNADNGEVMWAPFGDSGGPAKPVLTKPLDPEKPHQPEGVAVAGAAIYWTDLANDKIYTVVTTLGVGGQALEADPENVDSLTGEVPLGTFPRDIAAAQDGTVCWTYEDKLMTSGGVVACHLENAATVIAQGQRTPRAIAISHEAGGSDTVVYWVNFDAEATGGGIHKVVLSNGVPGDPTEVAKEDYPGGIAVDKEGQTIYWTSRSRGTVMSLAPGDTEPRLRARDQKSPGAIVVDEDAIYWINEGTTDPSGGSSRDGAITKLMK
jgi:hypothetical protein